MGTMSVRSRTLWLTLEIANGDIYFFDRKRLEPKNIAMATALRVSFCFPEHCFNISRDIIYSVFSTFQLQTI